MKDIKKCGNMIKFLEYIHKKHGPVVSFYMNETRVVSLSHYKDFKAVLTLFDRPRLFFDSLKSLIGEESIQYANGTEGRDRRKVYDRSFSHEAIAKHVSSISSITEWWLAGQKRATGGENIAIVMEDCARECLLLSARSMVASHIDPSLLEDGNGVFERLLDNYKVVWGRLDQQAVGEVAEDVLVEPPVVDAIAHLRSIVRNIVRARLLHYQGREEAPSMLLIDSIIDFHGEVNVSVIESEVLTMIIGGLHTSGTGLAWCLYYLAKNKSIQDKLFESLAEFQCRSGTETVLQSNDIEMARRIRKLHYLAAVISETLRVSQIAPFAARVSQSQPVSLRRHQQTTSGGPTDDCWAEIPAGTPIALALGVAMHDPTVFPDPLVFRPDRFLPPQPPLPPLAFEPFGFAGKRRCPADKFSTLEMSVWLIMLVTQFEMELLEPDQEVKQVYGLVTQMDRAVGLRLVPRSMKRDIAATTASTVDPQTAQQ